MSDISVTFSISPTAHFVVAIFFAAAAVLALGPIAWVSGAVRWLRLRRAQSTLRKLRDLAGDTVTLEGVLRDGEGMDPALAGNDGAASGARPRALLASAIPPADKDLIPGMNAVNAAAPQIWIEMPDGAVLLADEAVVASGSREILPGRSAADVRLALGDLPAELCVIGNWQVRCLSAGDRARASGRIERAADLDGSTGYRARSNRYRLYSGTPSGRIVMSGARPPRPLVAPTRRRAAAGLGAIAACFFALAGHAKLHPPQSPTADVEGQWGPIDPSKERDEIGRLLDQSRYAEAAALAEAAGDHERAARAFFLFGDLRRAATMYRRARERSPRMKPSYNELDAYIVAHDWLAAAAAATRLAAVRDWPGEDSAADLRCFGRVLHFAGHPEDSWSDRPLEIPAADDFSRYFCPLAYVDITKKNLDDYDMWLGLGAGEVGTRTVNESDPPPRVRDLLQQETGRLKEWRFKVPPAARALRAQDDWYRMPLFALEASAAAKAPKLELDQKIEQAAMAAVWLSFLGEHEQSARSLREALTLAGLEVAAPADPLLGFFEAPGISSLTARRPPDGGRWSPSLFALGAALAVRAGEKIAAVHYVDLVPQGEGPQIRAYVAALPVGARDADPIAHLWNIENPSRQQLLSAAFADDPDAFERNLGPADGQGLWPILAPQLKNARPAIVRWIDKGALPESPDPGFYGLLARYAGRRTAAQALGQLDEERPLGERIGRLRKVLDDRDAIVMLYVSGRLAALAPSAE